MKRLLYLFSALFIAGLSFLLITSHFIKAEDSTITSEADFLERAVPAQPGEDRTFGRYKGQNRLLHFDKSKYDQLAENQKYLEIIWDLRSHDRLPQDVFDWLKQKAEESHVIMQYELAHAYFNLGDLEKALFYFHIARIGSMMDASLFEDTSVRSIVDGLDMVYNDIVEVASEKEELNTKMFKAAINWHKKSECYQQPFWAGSHGLSAFEGKIVLIPREQWWDKRKEVLAALEKSVAEMEKPIPHMPNEIGSFDEGPYMNESRYDHTATLLDDGNVLIAGGKSPSKYTMSRTAELYLTQQNQFIVIPGLNIARRFCATVKLENGKVLFFGGDAEVSTHPLKNEATDTIEEYDPATRTFKIIGKLLDKRWRCCAVTLDDGRIFIYGGAAFDSKGQWHCELYDPKTNTSTYTAKMHYREFQDGYVLAKLADGRVFIKVGAFFSPGEVQEHLKKHIYNAKPKPNQLGAIELYDPKTDTFEVKYVLREPRRESCLIALPDNKILLLGGYTPDINKRGFSNTIEIFDPSTMSSTIAGNMTYGIKDEELVLVKGRYVLITGVSHTEQQGYPMEAFDIVDRKVVQVEPMRVLRGGHTLTRVSEDEILLSGGYFYKTGKKSIRSELFHIK
jgi:hypothetical protein